MYSSKTGWWSVLATALPFVLLVGCDVPTEAPSLNTETEISTPLVQEKTFSVLGGPESQYAPLIDTTASDFDTLFEVGAKDKDISVVQKIDDFNIGSLDGVLENASGDLTFDQSRFEEEFLDLQEEGADFSGEQRIGDIPVIDDEQLQISTSGDISVSGTDKVAFKRSQKDYIELKNTTIGAEKGVTVSPDAEERVFNSLRYVYPDVRVEPYGKDDQLVVEFVEDPCGEGRCGSDGEYERALSNLENGFGVELDSARVYPRKPNIDESGTITFNIDGQVNPDVKVRDDDKISLGVSTSLEGFEIQELDVDKAKPFMVNVTPNENGGDINIANDSEVRTAAFDGFGGITGRVNGLNLADVSLNFQVETVNLTSTDVQLYTAIQGTNETDQVLLGGTKDQKSTREAHRDVSSLPFSAKFTENGSLLPNESLMKLGIGLKDASLGESVETPLMVDGDNSNVEEFVNALPTEIRLAGQAEINTDAGDLKVRQPIGLDASFTLNVPLRIKDRFMVRDTINGDLSDLNDLTNPEQNVSISTAELRLSYTNGLPLGADVKMTIVDASGSVIETFNDGFDDDSFRIEPAAKDEGGAAAGSASGTFSFNLGSTQEDLRALADGEQIRLALNMDQEGSGGNPEAVARLRADDLLTLDHVSLNVDASIQTSD